ncbi:c-type cytochrome biogenesis protein CcmI [Roseateles sp. BYS96W]|uniref:C-type cytochrome biogenesis protein CcmI n=1 Tax=Pelomonas nitida TaxID=3299027 RepID=A0ABW7GBS2_9BURK
MMIFLFAAALLVALTLLLLLRPRRRTVFDDTALNAQALAARICREQLAELDRDLAAGTLRAEDHAQAGAELQRRLIEDTPPAVVAAAGPAAAPAVVPATAAERAPAPPAKGRTAWALAIALPLLAGALYAARGNPGAINPQDARPQPGASADVSPAQVEQMLADLAARAEKDPANTRNWAMLARSYRLLGRLPESAHAFERMGAAIEASPALLVEYADVLAALADGNLEGRPLQLVKRALEIAPNDVPALSLQATAAYRRHELQMAIGTWERALALAPAGSEDAKWLAQVLAEARSAGLPATPAAPASAAPVASATAASAASAPASAAPPTTALAATAVTGRVSLAPALAAQVQPGDTLFVYARPVDGRMPLAVLRTQASALPLNFTLDDSLAMSPAAKLSGATRVRVDARISRSGNAMPSPGDLVAEGVIVATGARDVTLQIDRVRP